MSEDRLTVEFTSEKVRSPEGRADFEAIYRTYIAEDESGESSLDYRTDKAFYYRAFFSVGSAVLEALLRDLEQGGARDLVAEIAYDQTGEAIYFARVQGKMAAFESREAVEMAWRESQQALPNLKIEYGKPSRENTLLMRLQIPAKGKRKKLQDLFLALRAASDVAAFKSDFASLIVSEHHDVEWCRFKWKNSASWHSVCSPALATALVDVQVLDEFLLLAFDLDRVEPGPRARPEDYIGFVFSRLDGVKKVWVKYRPKRGQEQYLYFPGMGDESYFVTYAIADDHDWPRLS